MEISVKNMYVDLDSPHVRESKTVLDSGFHAKDNSGFHLMVPDLCQRNLDSESQ